MPSLTITRTYLNGNILAQVDLDNICNSVTTFLNVTGIDHTNIQSNGILGSNIASATITQTNLAANCVGTVQISSSSVGQNQLVPGTIPAQNYNAQSANYTLTAQDQLVGVTTGSSVITMTLPLVGVPGRTFTIKKVDSGTGSVAINVSSTSGPAPTIDNRPSGDISLAAEWDYLQVMDTGTAYAIIGKTETQWQSTVSSTYQFNNAGAIYAQVTGNSLSLDIGKWRLHGYFVLQLSSSANYLVGQSGFYAANGANNASTPSALTTVYGPTTWFTAGQRILNAANSFGSQNLMSSTLVCETVITSSATPVYLVPNITATGAATDTLSAVLWAERVW